MSACLYKQYNLKMKGGVMLSDLSKQALQNETETLKKGNNRNNNNYKCPGFSGCFFGWGRGLQTPPQGHWSVEIKTLLNGTRFAWSVTCKMDKTTAKRKTKKS